MGTKYLVDGFQFPIYRTDAPSILAPYSDTVMHQLISACISDIDLIMRSAKETDHRLLSVADGSHSFEGLELNCLERILRSSLRHNPDDHEPHLTSFKDHISNVLGVSKYKHPARYECYSKMPEFQPVLDNVGSKFADAPINQLLSRFRANPNTLIPFFLLFVCYTGRNRETILSWQRAYEVRGKLVKPTEWLDPISPNKCKIRGWKKRGAGKGKIKTDDVHIEISDKGLFPILEFLLWYTAPAALELDSDENCLFACFGFKGGAISFKKNSTIFRDAINNFLERHWITSIIEDEDTCEYRHERLTGIDTRRIRKVFITKQLLDAMGSSANHQELANKLANSLRHGDFETTLGSYLSHEDSMGPRDIAILTLQSSLLEEAKKFKGKMILVDSNEEEKNLMPVIFAKCADPSNPDYAYAEITDHCSQYDMCLGCSKSRVFEEHLPRIAARIIQYDNEQELMTLEAWNADYGYLHAIAMDALGQWENIETIDEAWNIAKSGNIFLPPIIAGSNSL